MGIFRGLLFFLPCVALKPDGPPEWLGEDTGLFSFHVDESLGVAQP